jgi:TRAP-type C4-dicarboxylate transport system substrate-binding protein
MKKTLALLAATSAAMLSINAQAATTWDLPSAYPSSNLHTQNLEQFIKDVDQLSGGDLKITLHSNASLFKAPEIKRAVQGNQAQMGEILLTNFANEDPIYALDGLPFLATGYDAAWKLYQAQKEALQKKLASQGMMLVYTVAWPPQGIFANKDIKTVDDLKGVKCTNCRTGRRPASDHPAVRAGAGHGHRRGRCLHDLGLDRLGHQDL